MKKQNYFPESDYHGDSKNGENQIVIGLLIDEHGNKEITLGCISKRRVIEKLIGNKNAYLENHPKSKVSKAIEHLQKKIEHLHLDKWLSVKEEKMVLSLSQDDKAMDEELLLYRCCVVKTDLPHDMAGKQAVYDRYKDLTEVNKVFPNHKTVYPEVHSAFVNTEEYTHGQLLVEMFASRTLIMLIASDMIVQILCSIAIHLIWIQKAITARVILH